MSITARNEIIAAEQKAVDHAYACYGARLAEMSGIAAATASASGKDGIAVRKDTQAKAAAYGGLGDESLVVSRVDAPEDVGGQPRPWYVGRRQVRDDHSELVVVNWTSPLATAWVNALPESPGDVVLRRRLQCARHVVEGYHDEISVVASAAPKEKTRPARRTAATPRTAATGPAAGKTGRPVPQETGPVADGTSAHVDEEAGASADGRRRRPAPGHVADPIRRKPQAPDEFLLRELRRSRGGRMRDIVETIRRDQMALVTRAPSDVLVIQGGPGTGKSAVGLHRVTWLVHNGHFTAKDVLVVGPHQRFLAYVGQVLPTLGVRDVNAVQLERLWDAGTAATDTVRVRQVKSDERMAEVLRSRVERSRRPEALDDLTTAPSFTGDEAAVVVTVGSATLRVGRSELLGLLETAHRGDGPYRQRRDRFRTLFVDRLVRELAERSRRQRQGSTIRRDLERNKQVTRVVERLWPSPSAREALRSLYDSPALLRDCADGVLDEEEQAALHRPRATTVDEESWTLDDHVCLEEIEFLISGDIPRRYGHIVIDEAQDLTPLQARVLRRRLAVNGSMTVLGDLAQATGPHAHPDWDLLGRLLSDEGDHRSAELNTSYRVPAEIMAFAAPLARAVAPGVTVPEAVRDAGEQAVRTLPTEPWKLLDDTLAEVMHLLGTHDGNTPRSIAVIVPDDSAWLESISHRLLDETSALSAELREVVSVMPAGQAKGMEYDHVLVVEPATIADRGPAGLRQLYIALTRSTQSLTVLHTSPLPQALTGTGTGAPRNTGEPAADAPRNSESTVVGATEAASPVEDLPDPAETAVLDTVDQQQQEETPTDEDVPEIGSDIRVRVTGRAPGGRYKVDPLSPAITRPLVLTVRSGSVPPRLGDELDCWVFTNETNLSVLTSAPRGRHPISSKMAGRYISALGVLDELMRGNADAVPGARERLSELKGMMNRILRRDQADWVEVRRLLGGPDREALEQLRDLAAATNRALKDNTLDTAELAKRYGDSGWGTRLHTARKALLSRLDAAPNEPATTASGAVGTAPRQDKGASRDTKLPPPAPASESTTTVPTSPEQKAHTSVKAVSEAPPAADPVAADALLLELTTAASGDRTCKKHEAVRHALKASMFWADVQPEESAIVDVGCVDSQGRHLYEVLAVGRSSYVDLRAGATRLLEINHTLPERADLLHLVLCEAPAEDWAAQTVRSVFGVRVLWRGADGGWSGDCEDSGLSGVTH